ncbi:UTP7 (YER082C) [Zygosaccharomyces parabailii]|uniref:U three protein 7 n=1 Tax=Zygosaccharomyces bailii (strain CLIB 213 / ATCC 58445 / CBS 680 / BCRC 21525 / NBRC 1098 / NCYC 1416 / NRRL Y-2227) TaxID=1333698 RepID=A0A8J2X7U8_ZYGB2|nr:UTP7 (YER082C) [Zygosaccharomyces parabailii]AQZ14514.1 UTP7 (YER082C) [Zygosaccharomyces parabailii]CDF89364.1 ZYBA0S04-02498g1_1 [Zygosaccharomyces bailii CLIB 213]CDH08325.1 probable U3 small nucleolar RNA-associated protein 7 [Zygosaccharomyces bailii ISA1307]
MSGPKHKVVHRERENQGKFERPTNNVSKTHRRSKDKKLRAGLKKIDDQYKDAVSSAAATQYLLPESAGFLEAEDEMEKTFKVKQSEIKDNVDIATANKALDLSLKEFGPYSVNFTRNGTHLLIAGRKGHVASMDWRKGELRAELNVNESCFAATYLQNEQFFAVAQKKYTFIYDHEGVELHRLKQHIEARHLEFLPYHYLLVTAGETGWLKYQDVSTGQLVSEWPTKCGPTTAMTQNPWNAMIHLGHNNGTVSLWSPSMPEPLVKLLAARGPVTDIAIDRGGHYMVTTGADKSMKIWDIRNFKELHTVQNLPTPASNVAISDTGLIAVSRGPHVTVWKDALSAAKISKPCLGSRGDPSRNTPYISHLFAGNRVNDMAFVPFEDLLGVGHSIGVTNLIIPGAGEANFDALEANPYETKKQRQEQEVRTLLNKLPADTIALDPNVIGTVDNRASGTRLTAKDLAEITNQSLDKAKGNNDIPSIRPDVKGKNSGLRGFLRKKTQNVVDDRKLRVQKQLEKEREGRKKRVRQGQHHTEEAEDAVEQALSRFR